MCGSIKEFAFHKFSNSAAERPAGRPTHGGDVLSAAFWPFPHRLPARGGQIKVLNFTLVRDQNVIR